MLFATSQSNKGSVSDNWYEELLTAIADLAWWYGWSSQVIDKLSLDEMDNWLKQLSRQVKAGYGRGGSY